LHPRPVKQPIGQETPDWAEASNTFMAATAAAVLTKARREMGRLSKLMSERCQNRAPKATFICGMGDGLDHVSVLFK